MNDSLPPVVLHHGLFGTGDLQLGPWKFRYFRGIDRAIANLGHPLIVTNVHPSSSVERRARQLKEVILRQLKVIGRDDGDTKVILIGHSLGGLDARYAVAKLGLADRVSAVVSVTAPHRGSPFADWAVENLGRRLRGFQLISSLGLDFQAIVDLTTSRCAAFNQDVPDVPGVKYFSVAAARDVRRIPPVFQHSYRVIAARDGDNDGMVSVSSAKWGEHLATWPADHWHTINRRNPLNFNDSTGDIAPYWVRMIDQVMQRLNGSQLTGGAHVEHSSNR